MSGKNDVRALHQALVEHLKRRELLARPEIEEAFCAVPRHLFLPDLPLEEVYRDQAIATKLLDERIVSSSSQPAIMAIMLEQLELRPGHRVLEIGAGTGYNAALMAHIVGESGHIVTVDIDEDIVERARQHLAAAGFERVQVVQADGAAGYIEAAPYDRIILTVSAGDIAPAWREQLQPNGRLVLPLSLRGPQASVAFEKAGDHLESVSLTPCGFLGLRGACAEPEYQVFLRSMPDMLILRFSEPQPIDVNRVSRWIDEVWQDTPTTLIVTPRDIFSGLSFWLALHEPRLCLLTASGMLAEQHIIPGLPGLPGYSKNSTNTIGLLGDNALSVLRGLGLPDLAQRSIPTEELSSVDPLVFALGIRTFGTDTVITDRLSNLLLAWVDAGQPDEQRLHISAYPPNTVAVGDVVLTKQWTQFACNWR